jgi:hypothetical protein
MSQVNGPSWVAFSDRKNRCVIVLAAAAPEGGRWAHAVYDDVSSVPGVYDVWRAARFESHQLVPGDTPGAIVCIEIHMDEHDSPIDFPDHLLNDYVLGSPTLWCQEGMPSYLWWSGGNASPVNEGGLTARVEEFADELEHFPGFIDWAFAVGQLLDDTNWEWGFHHGVYCFVSYGEVVYVGRALGSTLGQRIWNQMQSQEEPGWKAIVTDRQTSVRVFALEDTRNAFMASALEAFLIDRLNPTFNRRRQYPVGDAHVFRRGVCAMFGDSSELEEDS